MEFGAVLQTNPPASRTIQLAKLAEAHGFTHVWTFDSHILWQEPYVIYSQILSQTQRIKVGPFVTNPATRDWTVTASVFATLNEMFGNRTVCGIGRGDSAVRVLNGRPSTRTAESPRPMPQTVRLPNISLSVANVDAVTVQSRVAGFVTIGPTVSRCVSLRMRL